LVTNTTQQQIVIFPFTPKKQNGNIYETIIFYVVVFLIEDSHCNDTTLKKYHDFILLVALTCLNNNPLPTSK